MCDRCVALFSPLVMRTRIIKEMLYHVFFHRVQTIDYQVLFIIFHQWAHTSQNQFPLLVWLLHNEPSFDWIWAIYSWQNKSKILSLSGFSFMCWRLGADLLIHVGNSLGPLLQLLGGNRVAHAAEKFYCRTHIDII